MSFYVMMRTFSPNCYTLGNLYFSNPNRSFPSITRFSPCSLRMISFKSSYNIQITNSAGPSNSETNSKQDLQKTTAVMPRKPFLENWGKWLFGSIITIVLPFWMGKWQKIIRIEGEVEKIVEEAESVAEVVEKGASMVEKLSSEVAEKLPEDGKLRDAVLFVEHFSEKADKDAEQTINFIHKVDEIKEEVEALVEPIINKKTEDTNGK